jgi:uncharacterized DUF497 family protein
MIGSDTAGKDMPSKAKRRTPSPGCALGQGRKGGPELDWRGFLYIFIHVKSAFRWNDWNIDHIGRRGIAPEDAQYVIERCRPPYPESIGEGKRLVFGKTRDGLYVQVIYVLDEDDTAFVIHARPLNDVEKRRYRRRIR